MTAQSALAKTPARFPANAFLLRPYGIYFLAVRLKPGISLHVILQLKLEATHKNQGISL